MKTSEKNGTNKLALKTTEKYRFLSVTVNQQSGRDRHDGICQEKEVGMNPAIARSLRLKLWMISGISGPRILVIKDIVNQNAIMSASIPKFLFIIIVFQISFVLSSIKY